MNAFEPNFKWAAVFFFSLSLLAGNAEDATDFRIEPLEPIGQYKEEYDLMTDVIELFDRDLLGGEFTDEKAERIFDLVERHPHQRGIVALASDAVNLSTPDKTQERLLRIAEAARENPDATMLNLSAAELILIKRKNFPEALPFLRAAYRTVRDGIEDDSRAAEVCAWKYLGCLMEMKSPEFVEVRRELAASPRFRNSPSVWNAILISLIQESRTAESVYPASALFPIPCRTVEARAELDAAVRHCLANLLDREKSSGDISFLEPFTLIYDELGRKEEVEAALRARLNDAPDDAEALFMLAVVCNISKRHAESEQLCERLLKIINEPSEKLLVFYAETLEQAGNAARAEGVYRDLIALEPQNTKYRFRLLSILIDQSRFKEALPVVESLPETPETLYLHAFCLFQEKDVAGARKRVDALRERKDVNWNSRPLVLFCAIVGEKTGDPAFVESVLAPFLQRHPKDAELLNFLGYTFVDRNYKIAEGAELIRRANELTPNNSAILDSMAWAAFKLKRHEEAKKWIMKSLEACKEPERTILVHAGDIFFAAGDHAAAHDFWKRALDAPEDEDSPDANAIQEKLRSIPPQ